MSPVPYISIYVYMYYNVRMNNLTIMVIKGALDEDTISYQLLFIFSTGPYSCFWEIHPQE